MLIIQIFMLASQVALQKTIMLHVEQHDPMFHQCVSML
jgi:hypothetical protein